MIPDAKTKHEVCLLAFNWWPGVLSFPPLTDKISKDGLGSLKSVLVRVLGLASSLSSHHSSKSGEEKRISIETSCVTWHDAMHQNHQRPSIVTKFRWRLFLRSSWWRHQCQKWLRHLPEQHRLQTSNLVHCRTSTVPSVAPKDYGPTHSTCQVQVGLIGMPYDVKINIGSLFSVRSTTKTWLSAGKSTPSRIFCKISLVPCTPRCCTWWCGASFKTKK